MVSVCILFPADPAGIVPGGIDTFIRGILRWAPRDINISLIGVTTDKDNRPVGKWLVCDLGRATYNFYAVANYDNPAGRGKIPLIIRFMMGVLRRHPKINADVLEFHRIEPSILFYFNRKSKNAFFHQNMQVLHNSNSDILWSKFPGLYFWVQDRLMSRLTSVFAVRRDAVKWYRDRYSNDTKKFNFVPTWYDPDIFYPADVSEKNNIKARFGVELDRYLLVTVGRLDAQKNPLLLADSIRILLEMRKDIHLLYIGDGVLRNDLETYIADNNLTENISLLGLKSATEIAEILRDTDLFVLSSSYEGMPMCVLEALGSGCPVVTTDVGEVGLVVNPGVNGEIVHEHRPGVLAKAINDVINNLDSYRGAPCLDAVQEYTPEKVLAPIYENYRKLALLKK